MAALSWLLVFLGGGLGSLLRYFVNRGALAVLGPGVPAGTLLVNSVGSLLMGLAAGWLASRESGLGLFVTTGLLGGFTTFSAFSLDAVTLWQRGDHAGAALYAAASVVISIAALVAGFAIARH